MTRFFIKFLLILFTIIVIVVGYLSIFGLETNKFNNLIQSKANSVNQHVKLNFDSSKIHLNLKEFNVLFKLKNPKILAKGDEIDLDKFDIIVSLKILYSSDFPLKRINLGFKENKITDLGKVTNIFLPRFINNQINKILSTGTIEGEIELPFEADGKISKNLNFNGKIKKTNLDILKDFPIKDLTSAIKYSAKEGKEISFNIEKGSILNLTLDKSLINIKIQKNKQVIKSKILTNGKANFTEIKKVSSLLGLNLENIKDIEFDSNLETEVDLLLNKNFKIINSSFNTNGKISSLKLSHKKINGLNNFSKSYKSEIFLKDTKINLSNHGKSLELSGLLKFENDYKDFLFNLKNVDKNILTSGKINLSDLSLTIPKLNYNKKIKKEAELNFNIVHSRNSYNIKNLLYTQNKNRLEVNNIKLNNNFEIQKIVSAKIITFLDDVKNNDFVINNSESKKIIIISGDIFDANPLLKSLDESGDKKTFGSSFNSKLKVNFKKVLSAKNDDLSDFSMIAEINKGSYKKMSLKGNFSRNEIFEMSLSTIDQNNKSLQVISDRASPFIKNYKFIKGFEGGKLIYDSTISKKLSNSNLTISNFKVSKVPALAQLLTLADLRGISDTLRGEGITFDTFEMKFNSEGNLINIEEAYAAGPAVSILLNGYVDKGKLVSLRGTLVPARTLNSIISKIPGLGKILVGEKVGEGVFGVSFKMKGPPKNIKTTVNPIKTLTPRFIVRAVERAKKKKQELTK